MRNRLKNFTLVELLVSLGLLVILLGIMLQFLTGAQKLWNGSENRNNFYSDVRVAMDLMTSMLETQVTHKNSMYFLVLDKSGAVVNTAGTEGTQLLFFTENPITFSTTGGCAIYLLKIHYDETNHKLIFSASDVQTILAPLLSRISGTQFRTSAELLSDMQTVAMTANQEVLDNVT